MKRSRMFCHVGTLGLAVVLCLAAFTAAATARPRANRSRTHADDGRHQADHGHAQMVITLFIDGGHRELYTPATTPTIAGLAARGVEYSHAQSGFPSDSFPGLLDSFTGNDPTRTGLPYEHFWDRSYPNGGAEIDLTETPSYPGISQGVQAWSFVREPTVFEAVHNAGLPTAFIASQNTYSVLNGPSGTGVDDLQTPTLSFQCSSLDYRCAENYDKTNFDNLIHEVSSPNPPALSGAYAMAPNQAMKAGGIYDRSGSGPSAITAQSLRFEDNQVARLIVALKRAHRWQHTVLIVTADHGNSPIRANPNPSTCAQNDASAPNACPFIDPSTIDAYLASRGIPVAYDTADDISLLWLKDPRQAAQAMSALSTPQARNMFAIDRLLTRDDLARLGAAPRDRTPDLAISPRVGFDYDSVDSTKQAEHGGLHPADRDIPLIIGGAVPRSGRVIDSPVSNLQIAPTIAALLGVRFPSSQVPPLPGLAPGLRGR